MVCFFFPCLCPVKSVAFPSVFLFLFCLTLLMLFVSRCVNDALVRLWKAVMGAVTIPVIASSGAGAVEHFSELFEDTGVQAVSGANSQSRGASRLRPW